KVKKLPQQANAGAKNYPLVAYFMRISCLHFSVSLKVKLLHHGGAKKPRRRERETAESFGECNRLCFVIELGV
ncbi:MAG: hypothetical protein LBQ67_06185, partial [Treponema sp.]|nr:hypothetical protein [Treponema sp.]